MLVTPLPTLTDLPAASPAPAAGAAFAPLIDALLAPDAAAGGGMVLPAGGDAVPGKGMPPVPVETGVAPGAPAPDMLASSRHSGLDPRPRLVLPDAGSHPEPREGEGVSPLAAPDDADRPVTDDADIASPATLSSTPTIPIPAAPAVVAAAIVGRAAPDQASAVTEWRARSAEHREAPALAVGSTPARLTVPETPPVGPRTAEVAPAVPTTTDRSAGPDPALAAASVDISLAAAPPMSCNAMPAPAPGTVASPPPTSTPPVIGDAPSFRPRLDMAAVVASPPAVTVHVDPRFTASVTDLRLPPAEAVAATAAPEPATPALAAVPIPTSPAAPIVLPALQVFGAAMRRAFRDDPRPPRDEAPTVAAGSLILNGPALMEPGSPAALAAPLDMRDARWPQAMAAHIERLRDQADAPGSVGDTRIRLIPDALGAIDVRVQRDGEQVHVHFAAREAETRALLHDAQPRLAEAAEARGLKLGRAEVATGDPSTGGRQPQEQMARRPAPSSPSRPAPTRAVAVEGSPDDIRIA